MAGRQMIDVPIVYVDQCHFSSMARAERRGLTTDHTLLALRLEQLVGGGKIVCPYSIFHVIENSAWEDDAHRGIASSIIGRVSLDQCIRNPIEIILDEVSAIVDRYLVGRPTPTKVQVLGMGSEIFRPRQVDAEATRIVHGIPRGKQFGYIVEWNRTQHRSRQATARYRQGLFDYARWRHLVRSRAELSHARAVVRRGYLDSSGGSRALLVDAGERLDLPFEILAPIFSGAEIEDLPMVCMMAEIEARRYVAFGEPPTESDAGDDGHLDNLAYARWILLDKRAASLAREAGRRVGADVFARPSELLDALAGL